VLAEAAWRGKQRRFLNGRSQLRLFHEPFLDTMVSC
jgi:hypothetical protein